MTRVQVLLSTFNGEAYLRPQLDSILRQNGVDVSVLIRDDGSSDETVNLVREQIKTAPNIRLIEGQNIGVVASYFALMNEADPACDAFAFCDQDDVWLPDKLLAATSALSPYQQPALFASPVWITDDGERIQGQTGVPQKPLALGNALVQNRLIGCTMVFNRAALALARAHPPDLKGVNMHDWWIYLMVSAFGMVMFHPTPTVLYRQHAANVIGLKSDGFDARLKRFKENRRSCRQQAKAFLAAFDSRLDANQKALIRHITEPGSLCRRTALALSGRVYRQHWRDDLILKLLLVLNRV